MVKSKLLSLIPVGVGGLIYLFYRPQDIIVVALFYKLDFFHVLDGARHLLQERFWLGDFMIYSVPGGLWCTSYLLYMKSHSFKVHFAIIFAMSIGSEFFQGFGILPGSMTWPDILAYSIGILLGSMAFYHRRS